MYTLAEIDRDLLKLDKMIADFEESVKFCRERYESMDKNPKDFKEECRLTGAKLDLLDHNSNLQKFCELRDQMLSLRAKLEQTEQQRLMEQ
jgi:hypothetical protein